MEFIAAFLGSTVFFAFLACLFYVKYREKDRILDAEYLELKKQHAEISDLKHQVVLLENLPKPEKKEVLTIEAQQILHDLTAHGTSIVKITPLSPTDVFWRSPR